MRGKMDFKMGNEARVAAIAINEVTLHLPSGATIALDVCYFVSFIIKNFIFILCLTLNNYKIVFENNNYSTIEDDKIITRGILHNDLIILDTTSRIMNVSVSKRK
ncbi:unnamed protein product [Musa textilis]